MSKIVVVGANEELATRLRAGRVSVTPRKWSSVKHRPAALADADLVIADLTAPDAYTARGLANLKKAYPHLSFVLRTDADLSRSAALAHLLDSPRVDFVRSTADAGEVRLRIRRLLNQRRTDQEAALPTPKPIEGQLVPQLHSSESGRLDARRVAEFFGIPLAEVARAVGRSLSAVHKTPSAPTLQADLYLFERIAVALLTLAGSQENARIWLNLPCTQLAGEAPIMFLRKGQGQVVAEMLDDMLAGQPT